MRVLGRTDFSPFYKAMTSRASPLRRLVEAAALLLCALLLLRAVCVEPYGVPSGSMSPALAGHHKAVTCPECGYRVVVGQRDPSVERGTEFCPNCGNTDLGLDRVPVCPGDQLLVNKNVFDWRTPRRWEAVVFRCPADASRAFVKRVVGLPGESVQIKGGDVYIDHDLARKTLAELRAVRIPVYDHDHPPRDRGWQDRWEAESGPDTAGVDDEGLFLRTQKSGDEYQWLVYRHQSGGKARAVRDEYCYNGADTGPLPEPVHDFLVACEVEVGAGDGWLALGVTDGSEEILAELPVGVVKDGTKLCDARRTERVYRSAPRLALEPGRTYRLELAFADRRATLAVDGVPVLAADRPAVDWRGEVLRPFRLGARGVDVYFRHVQLWRDVHYMEAGRHGSRSAVRLGVGEYFMLGDNSPNSDDSRFWTDRDGGFLPVREADLLGKPFLVHLPSRVTRWQGFGRDWEYQGLDWDRVRWLR